MSEEEYKALIDLIAEYELRARYNDSAQDYTTYSMLVKVKSILEKQGKE